MGGRAGGGAGAGRGGGANSMRGINGQIKNLTQKIVGNFTPAQKAAHDQMVAAGVNETVSAIRVHNWKDTFTQQPKWVVEQKLVGFNIANKTQINQAYGNTPKSAVVKALKGLV